MEMGKEIARLFEGENITRLLTIETSGIPIAFAAAQVMGVPLVFAKKNKSINVPENVYSASVASYTRKNVYDVIVSQDYILEGDRVLIIDDFLAKGNALRGLIDIVGQAGATVCGCAIAIEKGFQGGGDELRGEGVRVESLAIVESMQNGSLSFRD